jgi:hypothetical protein
MTNLPYLGKRYFCLPALVGALTLFAVACIPENRVDRNKFAALNQTALELKTVITSSRPCDVPDALVQKLASGIASVKDKTASMAEREVIAAYSNLLTTYKDGMLLCRSRTHLTQFTFVPKGRIYVTQEIDPIVERYDLATEKHLYKPTGQTWRSIDGNSMLVIWESAVSQTQNVDFLVNYN